MPKKVRIGLKIILVVLAIVSCAMGKRGVFINELIAKPTIELYDNKIIVVALNSVQKTTLIVYKIEVTIDKTNKIIKLKGFKAARKSIKNRFTLKMKGLSKEQLKKFTIIWVDPDNSETPITSIIN